MSSGRCPCCRGRRTVLASSVAPRLQWFPVCDARQSTPSAPETTCDPRLAGRAPSSPTCTGLPAKAGAPLRCRPDGGLSGVAASTLGAGACAWRDACCSMPIWRQCPKASLGRVNRGPCPAGGLSYRAHSRNQSLPCAAHAGWQLLRRHQRCLRCHRPRRTATSRPFSKSATSRSDAAPCPRRETCFGRMDARPHHRRRPCRRTRTSIRRRDPFQPCGVFFPASSDATPAQCRRH